MRWLSAILLVAVAIVDRTAADDATTPLSVEGVVAATPAFNASSANGFIDSYCVDCHGADEPESGLDLTSFVKDGHIASPLAKARQVVDRVSQRQMPPSHWEQPPDELRSDFVDWAQETITRTLCAEAIQPGPACLRRLNRSEYANTVRDLLGVHVNTAHTLPVDGAGGEGFDNASETLFISPIHAEKYLEAAGAALDYAFKDPPARNRLLTATPSAERQPTDAARDVLAAFLPRAFRRGVSDAELNEYVRVFADTYKEDPSYVRCVQFAMQAAMVSPKFLFLIEEPNRTSDPKPLTQHEMASRLSYFLWSSMPDKELIRLADAGRLHDNEVLVEQVARMLKSRTTKSGLRRGAKVRDFARSFTEQWLGTRALGREFTPDTSVAPDYDSELEGGLRYEPIFFFEDLLSDNGSLLSLIDSDFTYLNNRLAKHYGVKGKFREQPRRAELTEGDRRGGLLGMGAVLAVSSYPHRTSPVLRGKWILETLLGTPPPPPPPDVPELDESSHDDATPVSLRERLELHRADPTCASCHNAMDPLGFGLENYGVLGRWRDESDGVAIDSAGVLPDGSEFDGVEGLKALLIERKGQFVRNLTAKMLGYALSRGLTDHDACAVEQIARAVEADDYRAQTLIVEIVTSVPFRYKAGTRSPEGTPVADDDS